MANKREALLVLLTQVLKANFSRDEIRAITNSGVSLSDVAGPDNWASVSRGRGQKSVLSLMTRWPADDPEDALYLYSRWASGTILQSSALGAPNQDGILASVSNSVTTLVTGVSALIDVVADIPARSVKDIRSDEYHRGSTEDIEVDDVLPTFAGIELSSTTDFLKQLSISGQASWSDI